MSDNTQALQVFKFEGNDFRIIMHNDEPWWVASDVCKILGLANVSQAVNGNEKAGDPGLDNDEKLLYRTYIAGQNRQIWLVNEPGFNRLIFKSHKPQAEAFQRKVYHEVLPSIRKTGSYSIHQEETIETPLQGATVIDAIRNRLQVAPVEELEKVRKDVNDYVDATMNLFYPEKQSSKRAQKPVQPSLPSIEKPAPTPEYIQSEILRHMDRLSASGKTSLSVTDIKNYMTQYTRMQIETQCRNLVEQGVLQVVHTSHTVKYERVGKGI